MQRCRPFAAGLVLAQLILPCVLAEEAVYEPKTRYPVIEEMREQNEALLEERRAKTDAILAEWKEREEELEAEETELRPSLEGVEAPAGPDAFTVAWHFPPTPQYLTGTCWSFSVTSFLESEIKRLHGREVKLSEMWTAYWEFVEKARGYVASRGKSVFYQGSESNAFKRIYARYGVVPREAYEGVLAGDGRFNHELLHDQALAFLEWCKSKNYWDEAFVIGGVRAILDAWMGRPPDSFAWQGRTYDPKAFFAQVVELDPDDYVDVMSTLKIPFYTRGEFDAPDNWWHDDSYLNLPLGEWLGVIDRALAAGATVTVGGDVSEPGLYGAHDIAFVPSFDIPVDLIDQSAREMRIANGTTTDDHGVHVVGNTTHAGQRWFLIKDSNRSSRLGRFKGYYMYREDYVRLKMLTIGVHRDFLPELP